MNNYLSKNFWFNARPEPVQGLDLQILLGSIIILGIIGIAATAGVLRQFGLSRKKISQIMNFAYTNAFIGVCLAFFSSQIIPYLRARIIFLAWIIIALVWLYKLIFPKKIKSTSLADTSRQEEIKKYLPH